MKLSDFKKLIEHAQEDEKGNLFIYEKDYYKILDIKPFLHDSEDDDRKHYFGFIYTACDDLIDKYCSEYNGDYELYDRHFSFSDDTLEVQIVRKDW